MLDLKGRFIGKSVEAEKGHSLLDLALKHDIDWGFACTKGNCARCRCLVEVGLEHLSEPTDQEKSRLDQDEINEGFRLGCQSILLSDGYVKAINKTYF